MARTITFNIITTAQTAQLKTMSNLLKQLKRDMDAINKAGQAKNTGYSQMAKDLNKLNTAMSNTNKNANNFVTNLQKVGQTARTAGSAMNTAASGTTKFGAAAATAATGAKQLASAHTSLASGVTKSGAAMAGATSSTTGYGTALSGLISTASGGIGVLTALSTLMRGLGTSGSGGSRSVSQLASSFSGLRSVTNIFTGITSGLRSFNSMIMTLATNLGSRLRSAIQGVANVARGFANSVGSMFSGLQRAVQGIGNQFSSFGDRVANSMDRARSSMLEFYAAGYALLTVGGRIQQMGEQIFSGMNQSVQSFMDYERARNRAAIAGAEEFETAQGIQYRVNSDVVDELVYQMQRGQNVPPWLDSGVPLPVTFSAQELAQGLYYYSAAIGQPVTRDNMEQVGQVVQTIMQTAQITGTGIETMTKGVLNVAMEFGIDARDLSEEGAEQVANIAAQMGWLANISTMEVSDIIESMKMVGPSLNLLSGGTPGAGLEESFMAIFAASEVGLRGGNIGRGLAQAFQSLLDPTPKMIEEAGKYFPEIVDEATFNDVFFETITTDEGEQVQRLRGGLRGFFEQLASVTSDPVEQSRLLGSLFTSNATRGLTGVEIGVGEDAIGGMTVDELLAGLEGDNPFEWLSAAAAATANSVSGWFDFMKNGWFQFQASIVGSVSGPLMSAFRLVGEVLFEMAERITLNPRIGQTIAAIVSAVAGLAAVVGTIMLAAGGMLLLGRAFALLGGMVLPFIRIVAMAGATFLALLPVIALVGVAIGLLVAAFRANVFGIQDFAKRIQSAFQNFDSQILPLIDRIFAGLHNLGQAFAQFVNGILLGTGPLGNLQDVLTRAFGPLLGGAFMNALVRLRDTLAPLRQELTDFFSGRTLNTQVLADAARTVQGFFEQLFLGTQQMANIQATQRLGEWLGIDGLDVKVANAATVFRGFVSEVVAYARIVASAWSDMANQIWDNVARALGGNMGSMFSTVGQVVQGIAEGMVGAFTLILGAIEKLTGKIADFADGLREAGSAGVQILGFTVTFNGALQALGATIGLVLGAKLALAFGPFMSIIVRVIPILSSIAGAVIGLAGQFIVLAANIAITVVQWLAEMAVIASVMAIKLALAAVNAVLAASELAATTGAATFAAGQMIIAGIVSVVNGLLVIMGLAFLAVAGGASVAAGAAIILTASLSLIAIIAAVIAVAMFGVVIALTAFAAIALMATVYTQGWIAGLQGVVDLLQGVWAGMQFGLTILSAVVSAIMEVIGWFGQLIGVGSNFEALGYAIGIAIGVILTAIALLIAALASLAAIILIPFLLALAPVAMLGVAIYKLITNFGELVDAAKRAGSAIKEAFAAMVDGVELLFTQMIDGVTGKMAEGINNMIDQINKVDGVLQFFGMDPINIGKLGGTNLSAGVEEDIRNRQTARAQEAAESAARGAVRSATEIFLQGGEEGGQAWNSGLMKSLAAVGLDDEFADIAEQMKLDPDNMGISEMQTAFEKLFAMPEAMGQDIDWSWIGPRGSEFAAAKSNWDEYRATIKSFEEQGMSTVEATAAVNQMWMDMGRSIPKEPVMTNYMQSEADGVAEAGEEIKQTLEEVSASLADFVANMSLADALSFQFDEGGGLNKQSVGTMLGKLGDQIIKNAGDVPWLNMTELLADAAGTGMLDADTAGMNLHKAMGPALEILAQDLGVSVEQLLVDVPKFVAPEGLMNFATGEFLDALNDMPTDLYQKLDKVGIAQGWNQFGLDWNELITYGTSMAAQNMDWDFADYIAASYGIEVGQAEQMLRDAGIDPSVITQDWLATTEQLALSMNGQITVLTEEMLAQADAIADTADNFVIRITESDLANLPDQVKLYLDQLGYVFVADDTPNDIQAWGNKVIDYWNSARTQVEQAFGAPNTPYAGWTPETYPVSNLGTPFDPGGMDYYDTDATLRRGNVMAPVMKEIEQPIKPKVDPSVPDAVKASAGRAPIEVPVTADTSKIASDIKTAATTDPIKIPLQPDMAEFTSVLTSVYTVDKTPIKIPVEADLAKFNESLTAKYSTNLAAIKIKIEADVTDFDTKISEALGGGGGKAKGEGLARNIEIGLMLDATDFTTQMGGLITSYSNPGVLKVAVEADAASFTTSMGGIITAYQNAPIKVPVEADMTAFNSSLTAKYSTNLAAIKIRLDADTSGFDQAMEDIKGQMSLKGGGDGMMTIEIVAETATAKSNIQEVIDAATNLAKTWTATIAADGPATVGAAISGLIALGGIYATTYTATVALSGAAGAGAAISALIGLLQQFAGTYTAVANVTVNAGSLSNVISQLNSLDGRVVTSVANVVTNATTVVSTVSAGNNSTAMARGGRVGSAGVANRKNYRNIVARAVGGPIALGEYTLVGEQGPELVQLPQGSFVHTARKTEAMMADRLSDIGTLNPFMGARGDRGANVERAVTQNHGDTFIFYGDINIGSQATADEFFAEIDRRSGRRVQMARRGMVPADERQLY